MCGGIVAENSTVCRAPAAADRMVSMSSAKPMSSISSASSSTTISRCDRSSVPRDRWSTARPGVATTTSTPRASSRSWRPIGCPPYTGSTRAPSERPYRCIASETCMASSRVGASTSPSGAASRRPAGSRASIGRANAAVLPVPVAACPSRSLPASSGGIASRWIGVGSS